MHSKLVKYLQDNYSPVNLEARFDDMLDEVYSFKEVGGPFACMSPSRVLKECDPTAYRCGVSDFSDSEDFIEVNGDYYAQDDIAEARDMLLNALDSEAEDMRSDLEDLSSDEDESEEFSRTQTALATIESDIEEIRSEG